MRARLATVVTAAVAGALLVVGGCSPAPADPSAAGSTSPAAGTPTRPSPPGTGSGGADGTTSGTRALPDVPVRPARDTPTPAPPAPTRVVAPSLDLDMPVVPEGVDGEGRMALPDDATTVAWYRFGPAPASPAGATVLAAHVDDLAGAGAFARLRDLGTGSEIRVDDAAGTTHNYTVTEVELVAKPELPLDALFDRAGEPRLLLVTCGGDWDPGRRSYTQNVVVTARLTGGA
ncbi:class F sortase [Cellulosimicrobium terreum]|nr:class F sortase [Cellulosimicrobium terreum]